MIKKRGKGRKMLLTPRGRHFFGVQCSKIPNSVANYSNISFDQVLSDFQQMAKSEQCLSEQQGNKVVAAAAAR
jgi:hypothetical protein